MLTAIPGLSPDGWQQHALHDSHRDWPETNCYTDLLIGMLHARGLDPVACLGICVTQDFEGDHFTFFKPGFEDLDRLYDLRILELAVYDNLEDHLCRQLARGRLPLVEVDAFHLPDTRGVSFGLEHSKTTIAINGIDRDGRSLHYFHNAGFFALQGEDYDRLLRPDGQALFPYVEFATFGDAPLSGARLAAEVSALLARHLRHAPYRNPVHEFARDLDINVENLRARGPAFFHKYSFNTIRLLGSNFELLASHLDWLDARGHDRLADLAAAARDLSANAKSFQFQLARAVARGRTDGLTDALDNLAARWDAVVPPLRDRLA